MKGNQIWTIVGVSLVVAVIASIATASITGNVIKLNQDKWGKYEAYTKTEVDSLIKGSCQYVHYKDVSSTGVPLAGMTVMDVCQNTFGYLPKAINYHRIYTLHNQKDCSPSYQIFSSEGDSFIPYYTELASVELGKIVDDSCNNAKFPDGSSNGNFSEEISTIIRGVFCCKP